MAGLSTYAENKLLDHFFGKTAYVTPSIYVGLYTAAPTDAAGGTECTGGSYARKLTAPADWAAAAGGSTSNANIIQFVTATGSWGLVTHFGLFDALTTGNLLAWGQLTQSKTVDIDDELKFNAGQLTFDLD